jgi:hypothetical protein
MRASRSIAAALFGALALAAIPAAAAPFELIPNWRTDEGWDSSSETGAGSTTFVPAGTSVTPVLRIPIDPHDTPFWVFEQIGPDVQRLSTRLAPLPPDVAPGTSLQALFSFDVAVDNYAHILQGFNIGLISESPGGRVQRLLVFVGDPGTPKPNTPILRTALSQVTAGELTTLEIALQTSQNFTVGTIVARAVAEVVVPEPSSLALALTSLAGVLLAALLVRRRLRTAQPNAAI